MGRPHRAAEGGIIYHALNRANGRLGIFEDAGDYDAFLKVLSEAVDRHRMRLLAYCVMPNHFHLMLWPREDGELSRFMRWLTLTHTQRWHAHRRSAGSGHVYQGRFKSFPVSGDEHLLAACRYVERNALRANLVARAEHWRWGSLARRVEPAGAGPLLSDWPIERPADWVERVNAALSPAEEEAMQRSLRRGCPYGPPGWREEMVERLGLGSTVRPTGRPKKPKIGS
ncbi:Transposase IS200 like protein [Aquisphaera giovannonii]|uniref:Transposase IS200 like protein n=1 Tax=Aquisphaera giovannonii TaxID=406548 RepID=A0A5B9WB73_9BACT|nr:transposase [Aquisphaera giovannonii]QEH37737.1 Transposase IS200 like protein [Aquisphaera giovannonii]